MPSILFVCTGNIFRSMIAEHALRAALGERLEYQASSAGIEALPQAMLNCVRQRLIGKGIDPGGHVQRKLTAELLRAADLPVAMGTEHRQFIREKFGQTVLLFNQICYGKDESVYDIGQIILDWRENPDGVKKQAIATVDYLWDATPSFVQNMEKFFNARPGLA
jgi:protein-tyrosine phosphatase